VPSTLLDQSKMDFDGLMLEAGLCSYEDGNLSLFVILKDDVLHFLADCACGRMNRLQIVSS
jgi:hypothetical protein